MLLLVFILALVYFGTHFVYPVPATFDRTLPKAYSSVNARGAAQFSAVVKLVATRLEVSYKENAD